VSEKGYLKATKKPLFSCNVEKHIMNIVY